MDNVFLTGIIASLVTIFTTKILDLFQKKQEHKYSLQKQFFEKKLQAAEMIASQIFQIQSAFSGLSNMLNISFNEKNIISQELVKHLCDSMRSLPIEKMTNNLHLMYIYFDSDKDDSQINSKRKEIYKKLIHSVSCISILDDHAQKIMNGYKPEGKAPDLEETKEWMKGHILEISKIYDQLAKDMSDILQEIRRDIIKYHT